MRLVQASHQVVQKELQTHRSLRCNLRPLPTEIRVSPYYKCLHSAKTSIK